MPQPADIYFRVGWSFTARAQLAFSTNYTGHAFFKSIPTAMDYAAALFMSDTGPGFFEDASRPVSDQRERAGE